MISKLRGTFFKSQISGFLVASFFLSTFTFPGLAAPQSAPDVNTVRSIRARTVNSVPVIEIELHSSREFPVRDQVVVLRIGSRDFLRSRPPDDGTLNTLIFILAPDDFTQLGDGDGMSVRYGLDYSDDPTAQPNGERRWDFGRLNKAQLQR